MDKIRNSFRKRKTNTVSEADLQEIINNFEENFKEWNEQKNFFNNSKEINFKNPNASAQMVALKEINKNKIDDLINELRNDLKYNFFSYFWEKKEDLNLIIKLKDISKDIDNKIIKQNHQLLELQINKSLIEQEKKNENDKFFDSKNSLNYLSSFIKEINTDIIFLKEKEIKNKKFFLEKLRELNNKIKNDIKNIYYEIQELESKNNNIFEKIYSEAIMTNLISLFWSFRIKNNDDKYELVENIKTENKTNQNFLYNFELIDIIFNKYIEYIIKNEEKIFDNIFVKHNLKKDDLIKEKKEFEQNKCELLEITEKLDKNIISTNTKIKILKRDTEVKQKNIKDLKNRRKNIKNKNKTCKQDWEENKTNQDNPISSQIDFENKKSKKQYLNLIEEEINLKEKEIKNNKCNIADLEDSFKNQKNQLNIKNERIKKIEKNIIEINLFIKNNDNIMIHELQNIKEKWITKIRIDQKKFSTSLKEINKLKNIEFIALIDDFWKIKDNKNIILSLNKKYNVEHNIKNIEEKIEKNIIEMKMDLEKVETEFINKNKEITEIIKTKISTKFRKFLEKITSLELKNITTQTVINEQNENLNLIKSQKLEELEQKLDKNQHEYKILEQKLIEIKKTFEEEKTELKNENTNIKENFESYKNNVITKIKKIEKNNMNNFDIQNNSELESNNEIEFGIDCLKSFKDEINLMGLNELELKFNFKENNQDQISNYNKFDVPSDGSCLFWAISNAYLLPVRGDDDRFKERYIKLFGEEKQVKDILSNIQSLYKSWDGKKEIFNNENLKNLVTNVFRNRVVNYIKDNLDINRGENKATFRSAIENTCDTKQNIEEYLNNIRQSSTWGDSTIIEAITNILNCEVIVDNEHFMPDIIQNKTTDEKIKIFHVFGEAEFNLKNHYNFGLNEDVKQIIQLSNNLSNFCQKPELKSHRLVNITF